GLADAINQVQQLTGRPAEPVEFGDDHNVTGGKRSNQLGELRPVGPDAADLLAIDCIGSGSLGGCKLARQLLVLRRAPRVANDGHFGAPVSQIRSANRSTLNLPGKRFFVKLTSCAKSCRLKP